MQVGEKLCSGDCENVCHPNFYVGIWKEPGSSQIQSPGRVRASQIKGDFSMRSFVVTMQHSAVGMIQLSVSAEIVNMR